MPLHSDPAAAHSPSHRCRPHPAHTELKTPSVTSVVKVGGGGEHSENSAQSKVLILSGANWISVLKYSFNLHLIKCASNELQYGDYDGEVPQKYTSGQQIQFKMWTVTLFASQSAFSGGEISPLSHFHKEQARHKGEQNWILVCLSPGCTPSQSGSSTPALSR